MKRMYDTKRVFKVSSFSAEGLEVQVLPLFSAPAKIGIGSLRARDGAGGVFFLLACRFVVIWILPVVATGVSVAHSFVRWVIMFQ